MKTNKLQIFALVTLGGLIALGPIARADDTPATPAPAPGVGAGTNAPAGRPNLRAEMEKLFALIKPTEDQKEQLKTIFKERNEKIKALREDTTLTREDRMAKRKEIMEAITAKVKAVLSADQFAQYETFMKEQRGQARNRGQQPPAN